MGYFKDRMTADLELRGYRPNTRIKYLRYVRAFVAFHMTPPDRLGAEQLRQFLLHLLRVKKVQVSTLKSYVAALKFFYSVTLDRPEVAVKVVYPKVPRKRPVILSGTEVEAVFNALLSLRQRTIYMTMYGTGLRVSEACSLRISDIDSKRMVIRVREGKGGKGRYVMLPKRLLTLLREYFRAERPGGDYLFPGVQGAPHISPNSVRLALKKAVALSGVTKPLTPHLLRHAFATHMIEAGSDIHVVRLLLGHSSIRTTAGYINVSRRHLNAQPSPADLLGTEAGEALG